MNRAEPAGDGDDALFAQLVRNPRNVGRSRRTGRRSITISLKAEIIEACQPQPSKTLRLWIEQEFPSGKLIRT